MIFMAAHKKRKKKTPTFPWDDGKRKKKSKNPVKDVFGCH